MAARSRQYTGSRIGADPVGKRGIEILYKKLSDILFDPFLENRNQEIAPLGSGNVPRRRLAVDALHDRRKLDETAINGFEETVKFQGIIDIVIVHNSHSVVFHAVFFQQFDSPHHFLERRFVVDSLAVPVVAMFRSVDGYADQEIIVFQEATPLVGQ